MSVRRHRDRPLTPLVELAARLESAAVVLEGGLDDNTKPELVTSAREALEQIRFAQRLLAIRILKTAA